MAKSGSRKEERRKDKAWESEIAIERPKEGAIPMISEVGGGRDKKEAKKDRVAFLATSPRAHNDAKDSPHRSEKEKKDKDKSKKKKK